MWHKNKACSSGNNAGYGCLSQDYASNTFHKYTFQILDCHSTQKVKHVLVAMIQNFVQKHFDLTYKSIVIFLFPGIYQFTPFSSFIIILYWIHGFAKQIFTNFCGSREIKFSRKILEEPFRQNKSENQNQLHFTRGSLPVHYQKDGHVNV